MSSLEGEDSSVEVSARTRSTQPWNRAFPNYGCDIIELQGWSEFKRCLEERAKRFLEDPKLQYVIVENVSTSAMERIDYLRGRRGGYKLPQMRVLYDEEKKLMIVKLIPGTRHHIAIGLFEFPFHEVVSSRRIPGVGTRIIGFGSARLGEATKKHKQPDLSFMPVNTRRPLHDWPSVVVEVGVLESLRQLREDAQYWLVNSEGRVLVVILMSISLSSGEMSWERWEHIPYIGPTTQRQAICITPTLMQTVTVPANGPVIGAPFRIPSNKIWDIVPSNVGAEVVFTAQELQEISRVLVDSTQ